MQRAGFGDAGAWPAGMVGDEIVPAGLQSLEHCPVHSRPVDAHVAATLAIDGAARADGAGHQRDRLAAGG